MTGIEELLRGEGFVLMGVTEARAVATAEAFRAWIAGGKQGEMAYLRETMEVRLDPGKLVAGAKRVVCVAMPYGSTAKPQAGAGLGRVARYSVGRDYHWRMKAALHRVCDALRGRYPGETFRACVDTAPIHEREFAAAAGLGWIGKNTLLIHPKHGSYFTLGEVVTTLELPVSGEGGTDHCGTCTRCIEACPTQCIDPATRSLDARQCISYLTIEHRSAIDPKLHALMGDWIAGCDVCQEVCPYNRGAGAGDQGAGGAGREAGEAWSLMEILGWDEAARRERLRGSALKRIKLAMWKRNALIAAGNQLRSAEDAALRQRIAEIAADEQESDMVRQTAQMML